MKTKKKLVAEVLDYRRYIEIIQHYADHHNDYIDYCVTLFRERWGTSPVTGEAISVYLLRVYEQLPRSNKRRLQFTRMLGLQVCLRSMETFLSTTKRSNVVNYLDHVI